MMQKTFYSQKFLYLQEITDFKRHENQIVMKKSKLILLFCFLICFSCTKVGDSQLSEGEDDNTELIEENDAWGWFARLKLKPQADEGYLATEDFEIKALLLQHDVQMTQFWHGPSPDPEFLLYYDITVKDGMSVENRKKCIKDLIATGKFEDYIVCNTCTGEVDWVIKLKLKPQIDDSYLATEDAEIKALLLKHAVTMVQSWIGPTTNPELLLYYDIQGTSSMSQENRESCIKDFLATGKFEDEVYEYEIVHAAKN